MIALFGGLLGGRKAPPRTSEGMLIYAIGDIHGRSDLLDRLMELISADAAGASVKPTLVFIGDYIDRGNDPRGVVDRVMAIQADPAFSVVTLRGNHEQFLLDFLGYESGRMPEAWMEFGGLSTLLSYGVTPPERGAGDEEWRAVSKALAEALPAEHRAFLEATTLSFEAGSYVFVHAGVKPGVHLARQTPEDLMQIRKPFLKSKQPMKGKVVVYGHTVTDAPNVEPGKIGIDTGAFASSRLTALRLENRYRAFIST